MSAWIRLSRASKATCHIHLVEQSTRWEIQHCGHSTANWPYILIHPSRRESIVSHNGLGFKTVEVAKSVVERLVAGELIVTTEGCVENIARVNATAFGEPVTL